MRICLWFVLCCLGIFLSACSNDKEKLVIYATFENEQINQYIGAFQKAHPNIAVEIISDSNGIIATRLLAEKDNPKADIIYGLSIYNMESLKPMLAPLEIENLSSFNTLFVPKDSKPRYIGLSGVESVLIINEAELSKKSLPIPTSYKDLTNPLYKGLITMSNPTSSGTGYLSVVGFLTLFGEKEGFDFMSALDKNIALYTHSGSKPARMALSGEYPIGISLGYRGHKMLLDKQPISMIFPSEGYGIDIECVAMLQKDSTNPHAETFIKWATSKEAMALYAQNNVLVGIPQGTIPLGYPKESKIIDIDFVAFSKKREEILTKWNALFDSKSEAK